MKFKFIPILVFISGLSFLPAGETTESLNRKTLSTPYHQEEVHTSPFQEGNMSFEAMAGPFFSPITGKSGTRPDFDFVSTSLRLGWMLSTPGETETWNRGNWEALLDLQTSGIFNGAGNVMVGPALLLRYNFVQPDWKWVPYVQIGGGVVYTDAYQDQNQRLIGQAVEFTPQAAAGFHYFLNQNWSLNAELSFMHVSNANMASRNVGVNALGGMVGFSYFCDPHL
ncbi:MAG: acyloxyacyl hydrolase [Verrucomicrobiota bacterium]